jgi:hypothetical protein
MMTMSTIVIVVASRKLFMVAIVARLTVAHRHSYKVCRALSFSFGRRDDHDDTFSLTFGWLAPCAADDDRSGGTDDQADEQNRDNQ